MKGGRERPKRSPRGGDALVKADGVINPEHHRNESEVCYSRFMHWNREREPEMQNIPNFNISELSFAEVGAFPRKHSRRNQTKPRTVRREHLAGHRCLAPRTSGNAVLYRFLGLQFTVYG